MWLAACAPEDQNYHEFWLASPAPSVEITFLGADHTDFVEHSFLFDLLDPCNIGTADHNKVKALSFKYIVAFLNHRVRGWERFAEDYSGTGLDADRLSGDVVWEKK